MISAAVWKLAIPPCRFNRLHPDTRYCSIRLILILRDPTYKGGSTRTRPTGPVRVRVLMATSPALTRDQLAALLARHSPQSLNAIFHQTIAPLQNTQAVLSVPHPKKPARSARYTGTIVSVHAHGLRFRVEVPSTREVNAPLVPGYAIFVAWTDFWADQYRVVVLDGPLQHAIIDAKERLAQVEPPVACAELSPMATKPQRGRSKKAARPKSRNRLRELVGVSD